MKPAILGIAGTLLDGAEAALLRAQAPAGIILFGRNIVDPPQLAALVGQLRAVLPPGAVLMLDQEGGRVARLRPPHWRAHPPAGILGALHARDAAAGLRATFLTGALIGAECRRAGFDVICAPVADLRHAGAHDVIGDRAYGADPASVAQLAGEMARGLLAGGVQPVVKHAPGHGRALLDSHAALPRVAADEAALALDLEPFRALAHLPWMMTAHVCYAAWDAARPATLSPVVIGQIIRGRIGFANLLVSDDLAMGALDGAPAGRARAALDAGCDLALYCSGNLTENAAILAALDDAPALPARLAAAASDTAPVLNAAAWAAEREQLLA